MALSKLSGCLVTKFTPLNYEPGMPRPTLHNSTHYCTTSFNKARTQVLRRFKSCSRRVGDSRW